MARGWPVLALALFGPAPVAHPNAFFNADGSITLTWSLPADPSVTGLTIFRDNLSDGDVTIFEVVGLTTSFTDTGASSRDSFRFWIHTRNAQGTLSEGVFIEVFTDDDDHSFRCSTHAGASAPPSAALLALAAFLLLLAAKRTG